MSRSMDATVSDASQESVIRPILLADLAFTSGNVRVTSAPFSVFYQGDEYMGVGDLGKVSTVEESTDTKPYGIQLTLTGIPSDYISIALGEHYQGKSARVYFALLDADHYVIGSPVCIYSGRMDTMDIELGETATITLTVESRLVDWDRPRVRRYTDQDQKQAFPGDRGMEFVAATTSKDIVWGRG